MNKNKQLTINMIANFVAYIVTFGINFFLSPYIVETVGVEANGFVTLANNFISYAALIAIALNSLAGRFVTIKIYENDLKGANRYFTSVFIANAILAAVISIVSLVMVCNLEHLINIPSQIQRDVKILFAAMFFNCIVEMIGVVYSIATFATNKLYINSLRQIESNVLSSLLIIGLFILLKPRVCYLGITSVVTGLYVLFFNIYYTKKLTPDLKIKFKSFDIKAVWEILSSGVWNLITRVGELLSAGLDLLIANLFIDPIAMGVLSLAKIIPTAITGTIGSMVGVFSPNFTMLYAEKKIDELLAALKQSMKIMGILSNIPIIVLIVCGDWLFGLWQPTQDPMQLQILSLLTCGSFIISGGINCIFNLFTVVNKLKINSIVICITGLLNVIIVYILLRTTSLGIYAIAGVSTILAVLKNVIFTVPYAARCINQKWYIFYPFMLRPVALVVISSIVCYILKPFIPFNGWIRLMLLAVITVVISGIIGFIAVLNKNDREFLMQKLMSKVR